MPLERSRFQAQFPTSFAYLQRYLVTVGLGETRRLGLQPTAHEKGPKHSTRGTGHQEAHILRCGRLPRMITGPWEIVPSSLAQWAGAAATFSAVFVALFKDSLLAWKHKPRLDVTCTKQIPWTVKTPITVWQGPRAGGGAWRGNCYFVRVKVENTGRSRAEKVQVGALTLARRSADNRFVEIPTSLPFNMKWSNSPPGGAVTVLDGISPKMTAFCDIIGLCDPDNPYQRRPTGTASTALVAQLQLEFDIAEEWHLLIPGAAYRLSLRISAGNADPVDKVIEFTQSGTWVEDDVAMRRDYLGVSLE
jgi:hypothetical protein